MTIKDIFDEIRIESSTNTKMKILEKHKDNLLLKSVLYLAESKRIKFYIKQIPTYSNCTGIMTLDFALAELAHLSNRDVTGNDATRFLHDLLVSVNPDDAFILERIIEKDPKIGMGTTNINKIFGKNFIEKTPYMGAVAFDESIAKSIILSKSGAVSQVKMDGRYCNAIISNGMVRLESRGGEPSYLAGAKFLNELSIIEDTIVLNGELTMKNLSRYESNGIIASCISIGKKLADELDVSSEVTKFLSKHNMSYQDALDRIIFTVWDIITPDEYADNKSDIIYLDRLYNLAKLLNTYMFTNIELIESKLVNSYEEAINHFTELLSKGEEGTILKSLDGTWKDAKPKFQCKVKNEFDVDLEIIAFNYGTVGSKNEHLISSITVKSSDGLVNTKPAGITEDDMQYITNNQYKLLGTIVKVKCSGLSKNREGEHALLHPVFIQLRDDKSIADSLQDIMNIENAKKLLS